MTNRVLPAFLGIGGAKCGTTTLHDLLARHPSIFVPPEKELSFFSSDGTFAKGPGWYASFFQDAENQQLRGEITPQYMYAPDAPDRVHALLGPSVKLIVMLRNPADRAFSHYRHMRYRGYDDLPFDGALDAEAERIARGPLEREQFSYVDRGFYARQLAPWVERFGRDALFTIVFETDFRADLPATLARLQAFLGVPHHDLPLETHSNRTEQAAFPLLNRLVFRTSQRFRPLYRAVLPSRALRRRIIGALPSGGTPERIDPVVRQRLIDGVFEPDIAALERLLGRDLSHWRSPS
ncbi:MAG: sulfotransferase [Alphaproteobacteria bacterium]